MPILLIFVVMPIVEIWLLFKVGGAIGGFNTIALVILTALAGTALLRKQGLSTLLRAQQRLQQQQLPATEIAEGIFLAIGGALLLTPGFVTDAIGLACLLPLSRRWMIARALAHLARSGAVAMGAGFHAHSGPGFGNSEFGSNNAHGNTYRGGNTYEHEPPVEPSAESPAETVDPDNRPGLGRVERRGGAESERRNPDHD